MMARVEPKETFSSPKLPMLTDGSPRPRRGGDLSMTGPPYFVKSLGPFHLPPPDDLKPFCDTMVGRLDTWPAHSRPTPSKESHQLTLIGDRRAVTAEETKARRSPPGRKPQLLDRLEKRLRRELQTLDCSQVTPSELRLQAHREVFEALIDEFKTYRPLLSSIKNEYEMMLAEKDECIRQLEPLKQMLVNLSDQFDQQIVQMREEEKDEIRALKREREQLMRRIEAHKDNEHALDMQVDKLKEELEKEHKLYRDECDARKLLITDINTLRYQQEDIDLLQDQVKEGDDGHQQEDPVVLRIALKKAREDLSETASRLNRMQAEYHDVVPRRDLEDIQRQLDELRAIVGQAKSDQARVEAEHRALQDVHEKVVAQRDEFYLKVEELKRNAAYKPQLDKLAARMPGGIDRWKAISAGKNMEQIVEALLIEVAGAGTADDHDTEFLAPLQLGDDVPSYLSGDGTQVRNRRFQKRDVVLGIRDIWNDKLICDAERSSEERVSIRDFLSTYLQRKFPDQQMAHEYVHNLFAAIHAYGHIHVVDVFQSIFKQELDEELFHHQIHLIQQLLQRLQTESVSLSREDSLPCQTFKDVLGDHFKEKSEDDVQQLTDDALIQLKASRDADIPYMDLFTEDAEGNHGLFLNTLMRQDKEARENYVTQIMATIDTSRETVRPGELKKAITLVDPHIDAVTMNRYLRWIYRDGGDSGDSGKPIERTLLLNRLNNTLVHMHFKTDAKAKVTIS